MYRYAAYVDDLDDQNRFLVRILSEQRDKFGQRMITPSEEAFPLLPYRSQFKADSGSPAEPVGAPEMALPPLKIGSVILARQGRGWPLSDGSPGLLLGEDVVMIGKLDPKAPQEQIRQEAVRLVAPHFAGLLSTRLLKADDLHFEVSAEKVRDEPNEALIFAWPNPKKKQLLVSVLDHKGAFLFWEDQANGLDSYFEEAVEEPGLWLMHNGSPWVHKDWETGIPEDWGIEGDFRKITPDEAARRFGQDSPEGYLANIRDYLEDSGYNMFERDHLLSKIFEAEPAEAPGP